MTSTTRIAGVSHLLGPWYGSDEVPLRPGVYQRRWPAGPYSCWSGEGWFGDAVTPAAAARQQAPSRSQAAAWRGLAEPAEPTDAPCTTCGGHGVIDRGHDEESGEDSIGECPDC